MTATGGRASRRPGPVVAVVVCLVGGSALVAAVSGVLSPEATTASVRQAASPAQPGGEPPTLPTPAIGPALPFIDGERSVPNGSARLWFHGDRWWAVLPTPSTGAQHLWALDGGTSGWVDTGTVVDERPFASIEVAVSGDRLFVAATGSRPYAGHSLRLSRFTWLPDGGGWDRDPDFPVTLTDGGAPGTHLALTDDRVWLARLEGDRVVTGATDHGGRGFEGFSPLPGQPPSVGGFDVVGRRDEVRVVWRSRDDDVLGEAVGAGGRWRTARYPVHGAQGVGLVEAAYGPRPGQGLVVMLPTSLAERGSNEQDPAVVLVVLRSGRSRVSVVASNRDGLKHPRLVVDADREQIGVVATAPVHEGAVPEEAPPGRRVVVDKWADIGDLDFGSGIGRPLIAGAGDPVRPLVPVGPVHERSGRLVVAPVTSKGTWATVREGASDPAAPPTVREDTTSVEDTFEPLRPGDPAPVAWEVSDGHEAVVVEAAGGLGRSLELASVDGERVSACRALDDPGGASTRVQARLRASGSGSSSTRLLTLHGDPGVRLGVWVSPRGALEWLTPTGRSRTDRIVAQGSVLTVTLTIDRSASLVAVDVVDPTGTHHSSGTLRSTAEAIASLDEACVGTSTGDPAATLLLDELTVRSTR